MDNIHYAQKVKEMRDKQKWYEIVANNKRYKREDFLTAFKERVYAEGEVDALTTQLLTPPQALKVSEVNFMDATDSK